MTRQRFAIASMIDSAASGLWIPFILLFLVHARHLPAVDAGVGLTAGALAGLVCGPALGVLMDRIGPVRTMIASNVVRLVAFAAHPFVSTVWQAVLVATVLSVGDRLFWTANAPFAQAVSVGRDTERLLGHQSIARFAGSGLGAGITAVMPDTTSTVVYNVVLYAIAASMGIAALLLVGVGLPGHQNHAEPARWGVVLRNRPYLALCGTLVLFTLASVSKYSILPIVVLDVLHGPQWVPGAAMIIGTLVFVLAQNPVLRVARRYTRRAGLVTAAVLFACSFAAMAVSGGNTAVILAASAVMSVAETLFGPLSTATAADAAPPSARGRASALFQLAWGLSHAAGPALLTGLLSAGVTTLWLTLAVVSALAAPAISATLRRLPLPPEPPADRRPRRADARK